MNTVVDRQHAHTLIERLPESELVTAIRFLEFMMLDPVSRSLAAAPVDDESLTEEEEESIRRSQEWFRKNDGKGFPMEEVLSEFGLSMTDFPINKHGS